MTRLGKEGSNFSRSKIDIVSVLSLEDTEMPSEVLCLDWERKRFLTYLTHSVCCNTSLITVNWFH